MDLRKWYAVAQAYRGGGFLYHATMPTDSLRIFRDRLKALQAFGVDLATQRQWQIGAAVRKLLAANGFPSVAAEEFQSPGVVVVYTDNDDLKSGKAFAAAGLQIAAGVPLQCDEGDDFKTFRLGLFGLYKYENVDRALQPLQQALQKIGKAKL